LSFAGKLGISTSATAVRKALAREGVPPAPQRAQTSWRSFLRQHAATTLACDFLTVETVWLQRLYVLLLHLARDTPDRVRRLQDQPEYGVEDAAGTQPADRTR
jgi:hypothetical protein